MNPCVMYHSRFSTATSIDDMSLGKNRSALHASASLLLWKGQTRDGRSINSCSMHSRHALQSIHHIHGVINITKICIQDLSILSQAV